jgi:polyisoprenoid-binding protein YceI
LKVNVNIPLLSLKGRTAMPRLRTAAFLLALLLPLAARAGAQTLTFDLDPQATQVTFGFGATLHSVKGTLKVPAGKIQLDVATGKASGEIVLDMASASTGNSRRDKKMREKILETARYPQAVLHVERVDGELHREGRSELQLHGTLDFHGTSHPVALPTVALAKGDRVTATGVLSIPYVQWGLKDPSFFILRVEKEVKVQVRAVGRVSG